MSAKILEQIKAKDWDGVARNTCDPCSYPSGSAYFEDVAASAMFKKLVDLPISVDKTAATIAKWKAAEHQCYRANQRLYQFKRGFVQHDPASAAIARHLDGIRKIIKSWIGESPPRAIEGGFSPGATLSDRGWQSTIAHKISNVPTTTHQYETFGFRHIIGTLWHHNMVDADKTPSIVRGGEFFTVPKTALIERGAEFQPSWNIWVQLGYGRTLKRLLRANTGLTLAQGNLMKGLGWDIAKAQAVHGEVARTASVDRAFCTLDLSSASDTIAKTLVEVLLPERWYRELDAIRTHYVTVREDNVDRVYLLEKFSSMGNGFTFELETIIFAAIACYVTRQAGYWGELGFDVFVYGDDIIVRDELFSDVKSLLNFCGFDLNTAKSFKGSDKFRESCGGDFFNGANVRPFYPEKSQNLELGEIVAFANGIRHCSERLEALTGKSLNRVWFYVLSLLPKGVAKCRGPARFGDNVVYDPNRGSWIVREESAHIDILTIIPEPLEKAWIPWHRFDEPTQLACATLGNGDGRRGLLPRNASTVLKMHWAVLECSPSPPMDERFMKAHARATEIARHCAGTA